jgi:hypothetical protein
MRKEVRMRRKELNEMLKQYRVEILFRRHTSKEKFKSTVVTRRRKFMPKELWRRVKKDMSAAPYVGMFDIINSLWLVLKWNEIYHFNVFKNKKEFNDYVEKRKAAAVSAETTSDDE